MPGHGYVHCDALSLDLWIDLSDSTSCRRRLEVVLRPTVIEGEQALANWIAVADSTIVDEGELSVAPTEQIPRDLTTKRSRSKQEAFGFFEDI